jgi:hypothetical protein
MAGEAPSRKENGLPWMIKFNERGDQRPRMTIPPATLPFLFAIYALCAGLDVINYVGFSVSPQGVTQFACEVWPWALIKLPVMTASSVVDQCSRQVPVSTITISLIFLSIKLTMGIVAFPLVWAYVALKPQWFLQAREIYEERFAGGEKYNQELKEFTGESLGMLTFLMCLGLLVFVWVSDPPRRYAISEKILLEDFLAVIIPSTLFGISAVAVVFRCFQGKHRT